MLVEGPAKIMTNVDYVNQVQIILPYKGKVYSIDVTKAELLSYTGLTFDEITSNWESKFVDPIVYTDINREKFFNKFGRKE
jgi:hypothetical protein